MWNVYFYSIDPDKALSEPYVIKSVSYFYMKTYVVGTH